MKRPILPYLIVLAVIMFVLAAGAQAPKTDSPINYKAVQGPNSCYINASGYQDALRVDARLKDREVWSKLMYVDQVVTTGHCVCVFKNNGHWKVYDANIGTLDAGPDYLELTPQQIADLISDHYKNARWYE